MADARFTDADLERWVERGLISAEQRAAILRELAAAPRGESGLTLTTLLYYSGGLLVLVAYSIFLGFQWESVDEAGRVAIAAASLVFFTAAAYALLRIERFRIPGELLQVVAIAIVPLLTFALLDAAGVWPQDPGFTHFPDPGRPEYQSDLAWGRMGLGGATLIAAAAAFFMSRSPFVLIAAIGSTTSIAVDASIQAGGAFQDYTWRNGEALTVAGIGAATLVAGIVLRDRTRRDYTTWLYLGGLTWLAVGLGTRVFPDNAGNAWGALWMAVALIVLVASIPLQQRLFAAAGLAAVLAYFAKLVFDVFESANAALALVAIGVAVLGLGLLYQRYGERLYARR